MFFYISRPGPILSWRLIMKYFLRSFSSLPLNHSRRVVVSYKRKYVHEVGAGQNIPGQNIPCHFLPPRTKHPTKICLPGQNIPCCFCHPGQNVPCHYCRPGQNIPCHFCHPGQNIPLRYFLVQTAWTNHPTFLVSLHRVHITIIFYEIYMN